MKAITEIVAEMLRDVKEGRDVNLNTIKRDVRRPAAALCSVAAPA